MDHKLEHLRVRILDDGHISAVPDLELIPCEVKNAFLHDDARVSKGELME